MFSTGRWGKAARLMRRHCSKDLEEGQSSLQDFQGKALLLSGSRTCKAEQTVSKNALRWARQGDQCERRWEWTQPGAAPATYVVCMDTTRCGPSHRTSSIWLLCPAVNKGAERQGPVRSSWNTSNETSGWLGRSGSNKTSAIYLDPKTIKWV